MAATVITLTQFRRKDHSDREPQVERFWLRSDDQLLLCTTYRVCGGSDHYEGAV